MKTNATMREDRATCRLVMLRRRLLPVLIAGCFGSAVANPLGPQVVNGQASFVNQGNVLSVTNTPGTIMNWQSFSINPGEITRFIQQNPDSAVLNRIVGQDPSQILGALQSNGRVFLINPNGILFGQGAQVDVNGLVASTLNISNEDFLKGKLDFKAGDKAAGLKNQGAITTPSGGQVYLIAPNVENSGIITSPKGDVMLAAGHSVQLVDSMNPELRVVLSAPEHEALNLGKIIAQGGKTGIYGALIKQRGIVSADSAVVGENGKIVFKASRDTLLEAGSRTTATGAGKGGEIQVLGERVGLTGDVKVDASGAQGGGTILIGGDYQGKNPQIQSARQTFVGKDVEIKADAVDNGDGGKVILWADESMTTYGKVFARGGQSGGNGGFAEASGKQYLAYRGKTDLSAPHGNTGTLLLDPASIQIIGGTLDSADADGSSTAFAGTGAVSGTIAVGDLGPSTIYQSEIEGESANNHIILDAADSITASGTFLGTALTLAPGKNLIIKTRNAAGDGSTGIDLTGSTHGANLEFVTQGGGFISIHGGYDAAPNAVPVTVGKLNAGSGSISITSSGAVNVHNALTTNNGGIAIVAGNNTAGGDVTFTAAGDLSSNGGAVSVTAKGTSKLISMPTGHQINSAGGAVNLTADNINLQGTVNAGAGFVSIRPDTAATLIKLGDGVTDATGAPGTRTLGLDTDELKRITTSNYLQVGDAAQTGNMEIAGVLNLTTGSGLGTTGKLVLNAGSGAITVSNEISAPNQLSLISTGNITQAANKTVSATALRVVGASVALDQAANPVGVVAGSASNVGGFKYRTANLLTASTLSDIFGSSTGISLTGAPGALDMVLSSDSANGINQSAGSIIDTNGGGLALKTIGPVLLNEGGNKIAKVAADLELSATGTGVFELATSEDLLVGGPISGLSGIKTNSKGISITVGKATFNKALTINQPIDTGSTTVSTARVMVRADGISFSNANSVRGKDVGFRPYTTGLPIRVGDTACPAPPCLALGNLYKVNADTIGIGTNDSNNLPGNITVVGITNGTAGVTDVNGTITKRIGLLTGGNVNQTNPITIQDLGVHADGSVNLGLSNVVTNLAGKTTSAGAGFTFVNSQGFTVTTLSGGTTPHNYNLSGVTTDEGVISLSASGGDIHVGAPIDSGSTVAVALTSSAGAIVQEPDGYVKGGSLNASAVNGIGHGTALITRVSSITASNTGAGLNIAITNSNSPNAGILTINNVGQSAAGSGIAITNVGPTFVAGNVSTTDGAIFIKAASPLTVNAAATVSSTSGNITLEAGASGNAGSGDTLTIDGQVAQASGGGIRVSSTGTITLKAGDGINITGGIAAGATNVIPIPHTNPVAGGGSTVTKPTLEQCMANSNTSGCADVLPKLDVCVTEPSQAGCNLVLPTVDTCAKMPTTAGCNVVLPTVDACATTPTLTGCSAVLPTLDTCTKVPTTAGCNVVLPTEDACKATPTLTGCSVVLPPPDPCTEAPTMTGCKTVPPTLDVCTTTPTLTGCSEVLPPLGSCMTDPSQAGCTAVLPTLAQCSANPNQDGCSVVVPTVSKCVVNPTAAECQAVPVTETTKAVTTSITETVMETTNIVVMTTTTVQAGTTKVQSDTGSSSGGTGGGVQAEKTADKGEDKKDEKKTISTADDSGAKKNEPAKKMYCN